MNELQQLIDTALNQVDNKQLPALAAFIKGSAGRETAANMIYSRCAKTGCSVQTAMAEIDSEI